MVEYENWGEKPVPTVDAESKEYWEAAGRGDLVVQHCEDCDERQLYPRRLCRHCWSENLEFEELGGSGTVYSFSRCHVPGQPGYDEDTPYLVALVELDLPTENPSGRRIRLVSHIVDRADADVSIGDRVRVAFEELGTDDDISLPVFRPE